MTSILALITPFFGLIALGFAAGKLVRRPEEGLAWMQFFIVYVALPALFFKLVAATPIEQLAHPGFILGASGATLVVFVIALLHGLWRTRGNVPEATLQAVASAYSNIGYMGPGLTLAALGPQAAAPTAIIFAVDNALLFTLTPVLMAIAGRAGAERGTVAASIARGVFLHPFMLATFAGVAAAAFDLRLPGPLDAMATWLQGAAAPCALFAMGVTIALRPWTGLGGDVPVLLAIKLVLHPLLVWLFLTSIGGIDPLWMHTAVLMAALPPALNVFVLARHYGVWIERASAMILAGTVLSVATLTLLLYALREGLF